MASGCPPELAHAPSSPASLSSCSMTWSQVGNAREALNRVSASSVAAAHHQPTGVREVEVHHVAPHLHREAVRRLLVPRDRRDGHPGIPPREDGAGEEEHERDLAGVDRVEELGARDFEVVRARDGQIDFGRAVEAGDRRGDMSPEERFERVAPLRRFPEHLDETLLLVAACSGVAGVRSGSGTGARPRAPGRGRDP